MIAPDPVGTTIPDAAFTLGIWCRRCGAARLLYADTTDEVVEAARAHGWDHIRGRTLCPDCVRAAA